MTYEFGTIVRCRGTFTQNSTGAVFDPSTVKVSVRRPSGKVNTYTYGTHAEVIKEGTGLYYLDVTANTPGRWTYRWFGEGASKAANEEQFDVRKHIAVESP
jgi:hypothetical protein